jgi:hypothetical protein
MSTKKNDTDKKEAHDHGHWRVIVFRGKIYMLKSTLIALLVTMLLPLGALSAGIDGKGTEILNIQVGSHSLTATLENNSSVAALRKMLAAGPVTIDMRDFGGFEKVGGLGVRLPQNDKRMTTQSGDLILYQGNQFVIFYAPNTWSYTRLGKINDISERELRNILGRGNVTVTLSLHQ